MANTSKTLELVNEFSKKYPSTLRWFRVGAHAKLVDKSLHPNEEVLYAFAAQWNEHDGDWFDTAVFALTNERIIVAQNRLVVGFRVASITPDLYNDISVRSGVIWGSVRIDTVKEQIDFTNVSKHALLEIKKVVTSYMQEYKKKIRGSAKEVVEENVDHDKEKECC